MSKARSPLQRITSRRNGKKHRLQFGVGRNGKKFAVAKKRYRTPQYGVGKTGVKLTHIPTARRRTRSFGELKSKDRLGTYVKMGIRAAAGKATFGTAPKVSNFIEGKNVPKRPNKYYRKGN